ncbi:kynurenine formamidase isoform X2 [Hyla sarda]|uniref:kynurenine formamidase isoform X2 n=2 Tax=Hyla sarda TaxID=327740 RepID=UPI0024C3B9CF|nr:kynurenine formamidase isoform X2 [Hyla sarda]
MSRGGAGGVAKELDHQYSPSHWSHRMDKDAVIEAHVRETTEGTRKSRAVTRTALNIQYGDRDSEKMDLYLPEGEPTNFPILVYIHGGYWQFLSKEESGFMASPLVSHGIAVMVMDYDIAPKGDMDTILAQVRCSIAAVLRLHPQNTGIYLCGHSAGAHLVAMALCTDWKKYGVTPDIKGAFLVSGVYDLLPIIHTYVNDALKMSREVALKNSPIQCVRQINTGACPMVIVVAEHDSPEFHRQSQLYFQSLKECGLGVSYVQVDGTDHFDVIEKLAQEDYVLTQLILKMIFDKP